MSSLIDLIQSNKILNIIVLFSLWFTGLTFKFSNQCHLFNDTSRQQSASLRARIKLLPKLARYHMTFVVIFYLASFIKYSILILLDFELFAPYRYLDCYLIGHYVFYGRTDKASKYVAALMYSAVAAYKLTLALTKTDFKFYCLEFLLRGYHEAYKHELRLNNNNNSTGQRTAPEQQAATSAPDDLNNKLWARTEHRARNQDGGQRGPHLTRSIRRKLAKRSKCMASELIYYVRCCDRSDLAYLEQYYLRPSRSAHNWLRLSKFAIVFFLIYTISTQIWISIRFASIVSALITKLGFKLTYHNCFKWASSSQQQQPFRDHLVESTCRPPFQDYNSRASNGSAAKDDGWYSDAPAILPLTDLLPINSVYQIARILMDLVDFLTLDAEILLTFWIHFSIISIMSYEIYLNHVYIKMKLVALIETLEFAKLKADYYHHHHQGQVDTFRLVGDPMDDSGNGGNSTSKTTCDFTLQEDIIELQSILVDHFLTITKYNRYVSMHNVVIIAVWLLFNFILCGWLGLVGGNSIRIEFYIVQFLFYVLVLVQLFVVAATQLFSLQLYKLIASAMALDTSSCGLIRLRWITILRFYHPKPLYCFALFGSVEVSMFFCIKILSWLLSGMIVYASFLSSYKSVGQL